MTYKHTNHLISSSRQHRRWQTMLAIHTRNTWQCLSKLLKGWNWTYQQHPLIPPAGEVIALECWKHQFKQYNKQFEDYQDFLANLCNSSWDNAPLLWKIKPLLWKIESSHMWTMQQQARMGCSYYESSNSSPIPSKTARSFLTLCVMSGKDFTR